MLDRIKKQYSSMTDSQKVICKYILENYSIVATLSAAEFAAEVGVSDATIVRFAQEIGFSGFTEMKNYLRAIMKGPEAPYQRFLEMNSNVLKNEEILCMGRNDINGLEELLLSYDEIAMREAVQAIYEADTVYFVALGSSMTLQDFLILHFRRMGFRTAAISESGGVNFEKLMMVSTNDILIVICFPQYSEITRKVIAFAQKQKIRILAITDSNESIIGLNADIVLPVPVDTSTFFNSYVVPMALCNILLMELHDKDRQRVELNIKENMAKMKLLTK